MRAVALSSCPTLREQRCSLKGAGKPSPARRPSLPLYSPFSATGSRSMCARACVCFCISLQLSLRRLSAGPLVALLFPFCRLSLYFTAVEVRVLVAPGAQVGVCPPFCALVGACSFVCMPARSSVRAYLFPLIVSLLRGSYSCSCRRGGRARVSLRERRCARGGGGRDVDTRPRTLTDGVNWLTGADVKALCACVGVSGHRCSARSAAPPFSLPHTPHALSRFLPTYRAHTRTRRSRQHAALTEQAKLIRYLDVDRHGRAWQSRLQ